MVRTELSQRHRTYELEPPSSGPSILRLNLIEGILSVRNTLKEENWRDHANPALKRDLLNPFKGGPNP